MWALKRHTRTYDPQNNTLCYIQYKLVQMRSFTLEVCDAIFLYTVHFYQQINAYMFICVWLPHKRVLPD
jgi:hypothetical protein